MWVTVTESVPAALTALRRMFTDCLQGPVPPWLEEAVRIWDRPLPPVRARTAIPIWRDPWTVAGSSTFTGDLKGFG